VDDDDDALPRMGGSTVGGRFDALGLNSRSLTASGVARCVREGEGEGTKTNEGDGEGSVRFPGQRTSLLLGERRLKGDFAKPENWGGK
jgi:hypothetical protein